MAESLESHGYFKQQLLRDYSSGRQVFKGFALKIKSVVLIQQQSFSQSRQALIHYQEMRQFQALGHPAAGLILDCLFFSGTPSVCFIVQKFTKIGLDDEIKTWREDELFEFIDKFTDLFAVGETNGIYCRNISPGNFRSDGESSYRLYEFSGYYYMKKPTAYISPALRRYLQASEDEDDLGSPLPFHNPYKTEVYALGMIVLELMHGRYLEEAEGADEETWRRVDGLIQASKGSERIKDVLRHMLSFNEELRLDPLELSLYLKNQLPISEIRPILLQNHHNHLSVIQVKFESESMQPSDDCGRYVVLNCVCCFVPIRVETNSDLELLEVLVPLKCPVKNHVFCCTECMMKYALIETQGKAEMVEVLKCPICEYSLPGDIKAKINELWEDSSLISAMQHSKSARLSSPKLAASLRMSMPGSAIDFSPDIVQKYGCMVCCRDASEGGKILAHEGNDHFFCGESCWNEFITGLGELQEGTVEIDCPADGCSEKISVELAQGRADDGEESRVSVVSCSSLSVSCASNHAGGSPPLSSSLIEYPPSCVRCGQLILLSPTQSFTSETQPVFLYCSPPDHAFCSKHCFRSYIEACTDHLRLDVEQVTCPACFCMVEKELVFDCYGGEEVFSVIQEEERLRDTDAQLCMECKKHKGEAIPCGHIFCVQCRFGWSSKILFNHPRLTAAMPCPVCNQPTGVYVRSRLGRVYDYVHASFVGS